MLVKELIAELLKYDPDTVVLILDGDLGVIPNKVKSTTAYHGDEDDGSDIWVEGSLDGAIPFTAICI